MKHKILTLTSILVIAAFTSQQLVWACPAPIPPTQWDGALRPVAAGERDTKRYQVIRISVGRVSGYQGIRNEKLKLF